MNCYSDLGLLEKMEEMKSSHNLELEKLHKKLKWYGENQELLDSDMALLKDKRNEIKELRELVDRLESENVRLRKEMTTNKSDKNSDNTKILDLKRQVCVLNVYRTFLNFPYYFLHSYTNMLKNLC